MSETFFALIVVLGAAILGGLIYLGIVLERRKREAFQRVAMGLGLTYDPEKNYPLAGRFEFLNKLNSGSNRYAAHLLRGEIDGFEILAFDHHNETYSTDSKGNRTTHHHHHSVFTLSLPRTFPELTICPEGIFSKIAQAFGYDDIDFESAEFSRAFCVRSRDKRFAYDICHPLAIEFLLANRNVDIEIEGQTLAAIESGHLAPDKVTSRLRRLLAFRQLMPEYLLKANA